MKSFQIFKPGAHTASNGTALQFSESDLEATVRVYDPAKHEAPIVVGHPKDNHPAYGWVSGISYVEGSLVVDTNQMDPAFEEMVQAGRFKKRSASFYAPNTPSHPLKGTADHATYYLKHVGFLGAQPPAVKGLKDVAFADTEGCVDFEEDWYVSGVLARLFRGLRDHLIGTVGLEKADTVIPNYAVQDLESHAKDSRPNPAAIPSYSEENAMTPEQIAALQALAAKATQLQLDNDKLKGDNATLTANFTEAQAKIATADKAAIVAGIGAAVEALVVAGKVTPAEKETLVSFAASLDDATATFEFGEGNDKKKLSARALYLAQLNARPVTVDFTERSRREKDADEPTVAAAEKKIRDQVSGRPAAQK